jgi:hypothetical protein
MRLPCPDRLYVGSPGFSVSLAEKVIKKSLDFLTNDADSPSKS